MSEERIKKLCHGHENNQNFIGFFNQNENKGMLNSKYTLSNKNKNMTHAKQKSNKILLQGRNKNRTRL
jgi:hypothetical protein